MQFTGFGTLGQIRAPVDHVPPVLTPEIGGFQMPPLYYKLPVRVDVPVENAPAGATVTVVAPADGAWFANAEDFTPDTCDDPQFGGPVELSNELTVPVVDGYATFWLLHWSLVELTDFAPAFDFELRTALGDTLDTAIGKTAVAGFLPEPEFVTEDQTVVFPDDTPFDIPAVTLLNFNPDLERYYLPRFVTLSGMTRNGQSGTVPISVEDGVFDAAIGNLPAIRSKSAGVRYEYPSASAAGYISWDITMGDRPPTPRAPFGVAIPGNANPSDPLGLVKATDDDNADVVAPGVFNTGTLPAGAVFCRFVAGGGGAAVTQTNPFDTAATLKTNGQTFSGGTGGGTFAVRASGSNGYVVSGGNIAIQSLVGSGTGAYAPFPTGGTAWPRRWEAALVATPGGTLDLGLCFAQSSGSNDNLFQIRLTAGNAVRGRKRIAAAQTDWLSTTTAAATWVAGDRFGIEINKLGAGSYTWQLVRNGALVGSAMAMPVDFSDTVADTWTNYGFMKISGTGADTSAAPVAQYADLVMSGGSGAGDVLTDYVGNPVTIPDADLPLVRIRNSGAAWAAADLGAFTIDWTSQGGAYPALTTRQTVTVANSSASAAPVLAAQGGVPNVTSGAFSPLTKPAITSINGAVAGWRVTPSSATVFRKVTNGALIPAALTSLDAPGFVVGTQLADSLAAAVTLTFEVQDSAGRWSAPVIYSYAIAVTFAAPTQGAPDNTQTATAAGQALAIPAGVADVANGEAIASTVITAAPTNGGLTGNWRLGGVVIAGPYPQTIPGNPTNPQPPGAAGESGSPTLTFHRVDRFGRVTPTRTFAPGVAILAVPVGAPTMPNPGTINYSGEGLDQFLPLEPMSLPAGHEAWGYRWNVEVISGSVPEGEAGIAYGFGYEGGFKSLQTGYANYGNSGDLEARLPKWNSRSVMGAGEGQWIRDWVDDDTGSGFLFVDPHWPVHAEDDLRSIVARAPRGAVGTLRVTCTPVSCVPTYTLDAGGEPISRTVARPAQLVVGTPMAFDVVFNATAIDMEDYDFEFIIDPYYDKTPFPWRDLKQHLSLGGGSISSFQIKSAPPFGHGGRSAGQYRQFGAQNIAYPWVSGDDGWPFNQFGILEPVASTLAGTGGSCVNNWMNATYVSENGWVPSGFARNSRLDRYEMMLVSIDGNDLRVRLRPAQVAPPLFHFAERYMRVTDNFCRLMLGNRDGHRLATYSVVSVTPSAGATATLQHRPRKFTGEAAPVVPIGSAITSADVWQGMGVWFDNPVDGQTCAVVIRSSIPGLAGAIVKDRTITVRVAADASLPEDGGITAPRNDATSRTMAVGGDPQSQVAAWLASGGAWQDRSGVVFGVAAGDEQDQVTTAASLAAGSQIVLDVTEICQSHPHAFTLLPAAASLRWSLAAQGAASGQPVLRTWISGVQQADIPALFTHSLGCTASGAISGGRVQGATVLEVGGSNSRAAHLVFPGEAGNPAITQAQLVLTVATAQADSGGALRVFRTCCRTPALEPPYVPVVATRALGGAAGILQAWSTADLLANVGPDHGGPIFVHNDAVYTCQQENTLAIWYWRRWLNYADWQPRLYVSFWEEMADGCYPVQDGKTLQGKGGPGMRARRPSATNKPADFPSDGTFGGADDYYGGTQAHGYGGFSDRKERDIASYKDLVPGHTCWRYRSSSDDYIYARYPTNNGEHAATLSPHRTDDGPVHHEGMNSTGTPAQWDGEAQRWVNGSLMTSALEVPMLWHGYPWSPAPFEIGDVSLQWRPGGTGSAFSAGSGHAYGVCFYGLTVSSARLGPLPTPVTPARPRIARVTSGVIVPNRGPTLAVGDFFCAPDDVAFSPAGGGTWAYVNPPYPAAPL